MFLPNILILSCTVKYYIMLENTCYFCFTFTTSQILERHLTDCFEINDKRMIEIAKNGETVKYNNYTRKIKLPFMIHAESC